MPRWDEEMESAAAKNIRQCRDKLAHMPWSCEQCGSRGRTVCVLGGGGQAVAVCAVCRDDAQQPDQRLARRREADRVMFELEVAAIEV